MFFKSNKKMATGAAPLLLDVAPTPGFFAGTQVATRYAWTNVEELSVGDTVLTAQNGEQDIAAIERGTLDVSAHVAAAAQWPLMIPEGALGNEMPLVASPGMRVVIEDDAIVALFDAPCVSVRAETLVGFRGIARARVDGPLPHVTLIFDAPQTLVAQGGMFFDLPDRDGVKTFLPLDDRQSRILLRKLADRDRQPNPKPSSAVWI
jgi:hypothetical protein